MSAYTITAAQNVDELTSKAGGDTYTVNGGTLTIDQDSRYGLNQSSAVSFGSITISATLGGKVTVDATKVRLISFTGGSGTVPTSNTVISQGSASGKLIGVWSAISAAPTAAGSTMPTSGFIKIKQWNSVEYAAGALTGITATASGVSVVGWIELVGDESATVTVPRLGTFEMKGELYDVGTTTGSNSSTYQLPTSGSLLYLPGIWVETAVGSNQYEFYPHAGAMTALVANIGTEAARGKVCWISTAGLLRFQNDGTNATGGYLPPAGLKIKMPNIITQNCTTAARGTNALPNATLATRFDFTTTSAGVLYFEKCYLNWYPSLNQAFSVYMNYVGIATQLNISEIASPMNTMNQIGVGQESTANPQYGLLMALCFAGGAFSNCTWSSTSLATSGRYVKSITDISGFTFTNMRSFSFTAARGNATTGILNGTRIKNCTWNGLDIIGGRYLLTTCSSLSFTGISYNDCIGGTTPTTNPMYIFGLYSNCTDILVDGIDFAGIIGTAPYSGLFDISTCGNVKIRNIGSYATPLNCGGNRFYGASWTRSTTTATVTTSTAHGLKTGDSFYVLQSSDVSAITVATKTVASVTSTTVFTFTCTNAGGSSGTIGFEHVISGTAFAFASSAAASNVKIQRVYLENLRTGLLSADNSSKGIILESVFGNDYLAALNPLLNCTTKNMMATPALTAQTACYGSHWWDFFVRKGTPRKLSSVAWARSSTTATITSSDHGLITGMSINVTTTSDAAAIINGLKTITVTSKNTFTFTCLAAGGTSGTISYDILNGRVAIQMNESTVETTSVYAIESGTPGFTSAGSLYMPTIGQQIVFETPYFLIGHAEFPITEAVMAGGTIGNHDITYAINQGAGYGSFHNLYYPRAGGSGSSGAYTFTITSATGVEVGDYVWGTGIAPLAKVTQINSNTITVDRANTATVSGVIRFNHLPTEVITSASVGYKMKIRIKTTTTNTAAITSLYYWTLSDDTSRAYQYPLDVVTANVSITGLVAGTEIHIYRSSDMVELAGTESSGTSFIWNYTADNTPIYITILKLGYKFKRIEDLTLNSNGIGIIAMQDPDLGYYNPA